MRRSAGAEEQGAVDVGAGVAVAVVDVIAGAGE